jgi:hypothetical protein
MMSSRCTTADASRLERLYRKYVAVRGDVDVARLRRAIMRETQAAERGTIRASSGLLRELRAERAEVGALWKRGCR